MLQPEDIAETASLLARAMSPNPVNMAVCQGQGEEQIRLQIERFGSVLTRKPGQTFVARRDGRLVGILRIIQWPECHNLSPQRPTAFASAAEKQDPIARAQHWISIWASHDPQRAHWHLGPFAVEPALQRKGIGSQLLTYVCEQIDRLQEAAYLETDKIENVRRYERFGFSVIAEDKVFDATCWFMWRPPRENTP